MLRMRESVTRFGQGMKDTIRAIIWAQVRSYAHLERRRHASAHDPRLAVLVHSFGGYKRYWRPVSYFTDANLPSGVPFFFASELQPFDEGRFDSVTTGPGSFGSRLAKAVKAVERKGYKYVLYLQEDMWVTEPVDAGLLAGLVDLMEENRIDCLKLGRQPFPEDHDDIRRTSGPVGESELGSAFRWFGSHRFAFSHHTSIFRGRFLIEMSYAAGLFGRRRPLQQERFCSGYLNDRVVVVEGDGKRYRIGVFADQPMIDYVHASAEGELTSQAETLLAKLGLEELYDPTLEGEVFPHRAQH